MTDDWRIRIELPEEHHAESLLGRLGLDLGSDEAKRLARELEGRRLAVSQDGNELFVYASSPAEAEQARQIVEAELAEEGLKAKVSGPEHWLEDEERWTGEPPQETWEDEELERGYAPWEVRVEAESLGEAHDLAEQLRAEGFDVSRTFTYVIAGTKDRQQAVELARRVHGRVEPGGELVYEVEPQNPFAVFGGLGG